MVEQRKWPDYLFLRDQLLELVASQLWPLHMIFREHKMGGTLSKFLRSPFFLLLQALDEEYLKVDAQFGGVDQRKIFTFAEKVRAEAAPSPIR